MKLKRIIILLLVILVIKIMFSIIRTINDRESVYQYDVARDYVYDFNKKASNIDKFTLKNGEVTLPINYDFNQSMFLKVNIKTSFLGKFFHPSINILSNKSSLIQHFELGAEGVRYINISTLLSENNRKLKLEGKYVQVPNQSVELISFKNEPIKNSKILILAPHPDDAEIATFGLYSENNKSYIITVTAGEAGGYQYDEIYSNKVNHYLKKGEVRTWNSITVPMLGGIPPQQAVNLGFFDGTLEKMFQNKSKIVSGLYTNTSDINTFRKQNISTLAKPLSGTANWNSLVDNIKYLLTEIQPDIIITPYPKLDRHSDHKLTSVALFEAIKELGIKNGNLYLYSNHYVMSESFPFGKEGDVIALPPYFDNSIYFDSILSYPLSKKVQKNKIFALEAMNDLRLDTEWRDGYCHHIVNRLASIKGLDNNYYDRSVRSNELFFVVKISSIYNEDILDKLVGK